MTDQEPLREHGWFGVLGNPNAGLGRAIPRVQILSQLLAERGYELEAAWDLEGHDRLVERARTDARCLGLFGAGGDGTIATLINKTNDVPIGVIPCGTENLFAKHFGVRTNPFWLGSHIHPKSKKRIDLGQLCGGRKFSLMAGFGFDADVVTRHHEERFRGVTGTHTTSRMAYIPPIVSASFLYRFPSIQVEILEPEPEQLEGKMVFAFNLPNYALGLKVPPPSLDADGFLDLVVFQSSGPLEMLRYLWMVARGIHLNSADVIHRRVQRMKVQADATTPIQLDGDPAGELGPEESVELRVLPHSQEVLIPTSAMRVGHSGHKSKRRSFAHF